MEYNIPKDTNLVKTVAIQASNYGLLRKRAINMSLIEKISIGMSGYTKTDKLIASYILNNVLEFTLCSISQVSDELGISKTSLIRFAKKMGFDGYLGFRKQLQDEEVLKHSSAERFKSLLNGKFVSNAEKMKFKEIESIQQCYDNLDMHAVERMVELLGSGRNVFCAGRDVAGYLAEITAYRFCNYGYPFYVLDMDKAIYQHRLMFCGKQDILLVFDYPKYSRYIEELVQYAKVKQMTVIVITDYVTCPLIKNADLVFYCDSQTELFNNTMIAPLFLINLVTTLVLYKNNDKMVEYLKKSEELKEFKS